MVAATRKGFAPRAVGLLAISFFLCLASASSAFGAASYVFEPTLSLTGDCTTSPLDEVPDPGTCPIPPGVPGVDHPGVAFKNPNVTTDAHGDIYVVNGVEDERKIEVFSPEGTFITEFEDNSRPQDIAVDSKGNVYVFDSPTKGGRKIMRYSPTVYEPAKGKIKYGEPSVLVTADGELFSIGFVTSIAVDANDLLYIDHVSAVSIFKSAEEGNGLLKKEAISGLLRSQSIAVDAVHKKIYVSDKIPGSSVVRVFESESPYAELKEDEIDGSTTPAGEFISGEGSISVDVDDSPGHVFVGDFSAKKVYEFAEDGSYLATIEHSFEATGTGQVAVGDGPFGSHPQKEGWLFVPSGGTSSLGHIFAFEPKEECEAEVQAVSVGEITEAEATLHATINPCGLDTEYRLEYVSQQQFEEEEGKSFENENATVAGAGTLPKGGVGLAVSAAAAELEPGTKYRFRASAENAQGKDAKEKTFKTFPPKEVPPDCENEVFRPGPSALLPDCRAYELVTPPDTNGHPPIAGFAGYGFPVLRATADGNHLSFLIEGGTLPGFESAGSFNGDPYLASRGSDGWSSSAIGPSGKEAVGPAQRGISPDQTYSFWQASEDVAVRIRYPDGHSELVGRGSLGEDPAVDGHLITEGAAHIVFTTKESTAVQLEPNAPPAGTGAVYDRSAEGPTHVVSLLPGDVTPAAKENASYLGASEEGEGIAFSVGGSIYLRLHNEETFEVAGPGSTFAGVADDGNRVFYLAGGDLFAFDAEEEETIPFSSSGDITLVNIASGGTRAYFVSPSVLTGEPNPNGEEAEGGKENLYLSEEGAISFVGIVTERDVEGEEIASGLAGGLGLWIKGIKEVAPDIDPSRATPSGSTLLFESRANLTGFESDGFAQIFRFDATEGRLDCLSCSLTETPPTSDASLQSIQPEQFSQQPAGNQLKIPNQTPDGARAFFQTAEPLVVGDTDEQLDVYEWEAGGVGSCANPAGCVYLVSGGHSPSPDYLFAVSASGNDVFFRTADQLLLPRDTEATLSIYDARVGGGFPEPQEGTPCAGSDACRPTPTPPPSSPQSTTGTGTDGNVLPQQKKNCPKGKHKAKRHGKTVCVKNHKKHHGRAGSNGKGGAR